MKRKLTAIFLTVLGFFIACFSISLLLQIKEWHAIIYLFIALATGVACIIDGWLVWRGESIKDTLRELFEMFFVRF